MVSIRAAKARAELAPFTMPRTLGDSNVRYVVIAERQKEFVNSLDAEGKRLLAEIAGEATNTSDPELLKTTSPTTAP